TDNRLSDETGFIPLPSAMPPQSFLPGLQVGAFAVAMTGSEVTWQIGDQSATAVAGAAPVSLTIMPDGHLLVTRPDSGSFVVSALSSSTVNGNVTVGAPSLDPTSINLQIFWQPPTDWQKLAGALETLAKPIQQVAAIVGGVVTVVSAALLVARFVGILPEP